MKNLIFWLFYLQRCDIQQILYYFRSVLCKSSFSSSLFVCLEHNLVSFLCAHLFLCIKNNRFYYSRNLLRRLNCRKIIGIVDWFVMNCWVLWNCSRHCLLILLLLLWLYLLDLFLLLFCIYFLLSFLLFFRLLFRLFSLCFTF